MSSYFLQTLQYVVLSSSNVAISSSNIVMCRSLVDCHAR